MRTPVSASVLVLAWVLGACAAPPVPRPDELGNRIRVRVAGRGTVPSITTADYFLYFVVRGPDGRRASLRVLASETAESEGTALFLGKKIEVLLDLPRVQVVETLHGDTDCAEDIVLAPGCSLCFEPGSHYAYRIVDRSWRMAADRDPELHVGMITADGTGYVELQPASGPLLQRAQDPPGWPPAGVR